MEQKVSSLIICFLNAKDLLNANNSERFFNAFYATGFFLYLLKTSENLWFSDILEGIERCHWHEMG